jgi:hypothetical protein
MPKTHPRDSVESRRGNRGPRARRPSTPLQLGAARYIMHRHTVRRCRAAADVSRERPRLPVGSHAQRLDAGSLGGLFPGCGPRDLEQRLEDQRGPTVCSDYRCQRCVRCHARRTRCSGVSGKGPAFPSCNAAIAASVKSDDAIGRTRLRVVARSWSHRVGDTHRTPRILANVAVWALHLPDSAVRS